MITIYGIKNCDTMKKARKWLDEHSIEYGFHDYRKDGLDKQQLNEWVKLLSWEVLLNKRGTTWRKLPEEVRYHIDEKIAIELMLAQPAMIKRPLLDTGSELSVGFSPENYKQLFKN
ncbi:MAG: ArsC family reductase [Gammaproteobacteria bacterium]